MTKTIVTGANGLVGYAIRQINMPDTKYLARNDVDLTDFISTSKCFVELAP